MTRTTSMTHPNGVKFTAIAPYKVIKTDFGFFKFPNKHAQAGVLIEYPNGTKRFISNEFYNDINI